jgi:DNA-binding response OmpR family regulator
MPYPFRLILYWKQAPPSGSSCIGKDSVLERLKESDTLSQIPVIVMTGRDPQFNEQKTLQAGATAFFQKPTDDSELLDVIRVTLSNTLPAVALAASHTGK